jgi:60 kDa SS-A/Ro ribonucleoprotein
MTFSDNAQYRQLNIRNSTLSIANDLNFAAGGTNFHAIFQTINQRYDRIIILSDMQGWIGGYSPKASFDAYKAKYKANPFIYSFDLQGYGSLQFPENKVFALAGFSDKIFDLMALLETDPKAIVNEINKVTFKV